MNENIEDLEDLEDAHVAQARLRDYRQGLTDSVDLHTVMAENGMKE